MKHLFFFIITILIYNNVSASIIYRVDNGLYRDSSDWAEGPTPYAACSAYVGGDSGRRNAVLFYNNTICHYETDYGPYDIPVTSSGTNEPTCISPFFLNTTSNQCELSCPSGTHPASNNESCEDDIVQDTCPDSLNQCVAQCGNQSNIETFACSNNIVTSPCVCTPEPDLCWQGFQACQAQCSATSIATYNCTNDQTVTPCTCAAPSPNCQSHQTFLDNEGCIDVCYGGDNSGSLNDNRCEGDEISINNSEGQILTALNQWNESIMNSADRSELIAVETRGALGSIASNQGTLNTSIQTSTTATRDTTLAVQANTSAINEGNGLLSEIRTNTANTNDSLQVNTVSIDAGEFSSLELEVQASKDQLTATFNSLKTDIVATININGLAGGGTREARHITVDNQNIDLDMSSLDIFYQITGLLLMVSAYWRGIVIVLGGGGK